MKQCLDFRVILSRGRSNIQMQKKGAVEPSQAMRPRPLLIWNVKRHLTKMQCTYISAYCVQGIAHSINEADITLYEDLDAGLRVLLTSNAIPHLALLNRQIALGWMMFRGMIGVPIAPDFPELLAVETEKVNQQRRDSIGGDPVVVIQVESDEEAAVPLDAREILDFIVCVDAFDKKALKSNVSDQVGAVLTAIRLGLAESLEFRRVVDGSYLTADDGRVVHSLSWEISGGGAYISQRLSGLQRARVALDISLTLKAGSLERVLRLYAQALDTSTDNYRAFIFAWTALEILINKLFPTYQRLLADELRAVNESPGLHAYLDRVTAVMGDKLTLADKFAVLTVYLDDASIEDEVHAFRKLKRVRNQMLHGEDVEEVMLPTRDVQCLFDKYLRNHLRRGE